MRSNVWFVALLTLACVSVFPIAGHAGVAIGGDLVTRNTAIETSVSDHIRVAFNLSDGSFKAVQSLHLGDGDSAFLLAMAESMPGGLTDANIKTVLALRWSSPPMMWGDVASELNMDLTPAALRAEKVLGEIRGSSI